MLDKIRNWIKFTFDRDDLTKIKVDHHGYTLKEHPTIGPIDIVSEIKKIPGLVYKLETSVGLYASTHYVTVTNEVGKIIELYMALDNTYADMNLSEFITRTIHQDATEKTI